MMHAVLWMKAVWYLMITNRLSGLFIQLFWLKSTTVTIAHTLLDNVVLHL